MAALVLLFEMLVNDDACGMVASFFVISDVYHRSHVMRSTLERLTFTSRP